MSKEAAPSPYRIIDVIALIEIFRAPFVYRFLAIFSVAILFYLLLLNAVQIIICNKKSFTYSFLTFLDLHTERNDECDHEYNRNMNDLGHSLAQTTIKDEPRHNFQGDRLMVDQNSFSGINTCPTASQSALVQLLTTNRQLSPFRKDDQQNHVGFNQSEIDNGNFSHMLYFVRFCLHYVYWSASLILKAIKLMALLAKAKCSNIHKRKVVELRVDEIDRGEIRNMSDSLYSGRQAPCR